MSGVVLNANDSLSHSVINLSPLPPLRPLREARTHVVSRQHCACAGVRRTHAFARSGAGGDRVTRRDLRTLTPVSSPLSTPPTVQWPSGKEAGRPGEGGAAHILRRLRRRARADRRRGQRPRGVISSSLSLSSPAILSKLRWCGVSAQQ